MQSKGFHSNIFNFLQNGAGAYWFSSIIREGILATQLRIAEVSKPRPKVPRIDSENRIVIIRYQLATGNHFLTKGLGKRFIIVQNWTEWIHWKESTVKGVSRGGAVDGLVGQYHKAKRIWKRAVKSKVH